MGAFTSVLVLLVISIASNAQRAPKRFQGKLSRTTKPNRNTKNIESSPKLKDTADYEDYYYYDYYYDEQPLPSGPTREPPLPSGPTRRPGQAMTLSPKPRKSVSPALNKFLNLPFLTTKRPSKQKEAKRIPKRKLLDQLGHFQQHFIAPPIVNAGALPLAHESSIPLNRFPPFNKPVNTKQRDRE